MRNEFDISPQMITKAQELGLEPSRLPLLLLVPFVQVAWAEGSVQAGEQKAILNFAGRFKLLGHSAFETLLSWFDERPADEFFDRSIRELRDLLNRLPANQAEGLRTILRSGCHEVANASGAAGFMRGNSNVHREERAQLEKISERLGLRQVYA